MTEIYCLKDKIVGSWWGEKIRVYCYRTPNHKGNHKYVYPSFTQPSEETPSAEYRFRFL